MNTEETKKEIWVSDAQKEVWEWKEALSKQIENMSMLEAIQYIQERARKTREEIEAARKMRIEKSAD